MTIVSDIDIGLDQVPADQAIGYLKDLINKTTNVEDKAELKKKIELILGNVDIKTQLHMVILLHGIRTFAPWQQTVKDEFRPYPQIKVFHFTYDYFGLCKFLNPEKYKNEPISRIRKKIQQAIERNPDATVSLVAHSYGSYIISELLNEFKIDNLILCGSIVNERYEWEKLTGNMLVINEAGSNDIWPVIASHVSSYYGSTGTFGFNDSFVEDRFHTNRHSDYFNQTFIKKYWVPFLLYGHIVPSNWGQNNNKFPFLIEKCSSTSTWILVVISIFLLPLFTLYKLLTYIAYIFLKFRNFVFN